MLTLRIKCMLTFGEFMNSIVVMKLQLIGSIQLIKERLLYRKNAFNDGLCAKLNINVPASITIDGYLPKR